MIKILRLAAVFHKIFPEKLCFIGVQGFHFGGEYVLEKNISAQLQYFIGERVSPRYQGKHTNKIYAKVEFDF